MEQIIGGRQVVKEALRIGSSLVREVLLKKQEKETKIQDEIVQSCLSLGIPFRYVNPDELDKLNPDYPHQGVLARIIQGSKSFHHLEKMIEKENLKSPFRFILLDSIQDPRNLGAIARSAYFFHMQALILTKDRCAPVSDVAMKASAGALVHLPVLTVVNLVRCMEELKELGCWIYGFDANDGIALQKMDFARDVAFVLGAEGKGIRPLVKKNCDILVNIIGSSELDSLNVSVTAGIAFYQLSLSL